jgi:hypothetical protein
MVIPIEVVRLECSRVPLELAGGRQLKASTVVVATIEARMCRHEEVAIVGGMPGYTANCCAPGRVARSALAKGNVACENPVK